MEFYLSRVCCLPRHVSLPPIAVRFASVKLGLFVSQLSQVSPCLIFGAELEVFFPSVHSNPFVCVPLRNSKPPVPLADRPISLSLVERMSAAQTILGLLKKVRPNPHAVLCHWECLFERAAACLLAAEEPSGRASSAIAQATARPRSVHPCPESHPHCLPNRQTSAVATRPRTWTKVSVSWPCRTSRQSWRTWPVGLVPLPQVVRLRDLRENAFP